DLHLELAGIGNRILAALIDTTITGTIIAGIALLGVIVAVLLDQAGLDGDVRNLAMLVVVMISVFLAFFINFGYHIFFEGVWMGQTPGKKIAQIRVIEANGQPIGWAAVFIRNIVRVLDTGLLLIGLLVMLINKNEKRIGDLAAGTLVIRERKPDMKNFGIKILTDATADTLVDIGRVTPQEYDLLARFLRRREGLSPSQRPLVAVKVAEYFQEKLNEPDQQAKSNSEQYLEKLYLSYQARAEE
ncbi:MAG: RDD family protein, partial [Cyanobacteria bacterium]|nr:RDD family protein [Cyanobacteriota bacterium]